MPLSRTALAFLVFCLAGTARAEGWPVSRGPSHEPVPFTYHPDQVQKLPKAFLEDTPACTLYSGNTYLVEADGTVEAITHEIVRFNGRKGIEKLGEYRNASYDPAYQKLTLHRARVLKADGRAVDIGPGHVQLRDVSTDYAVYDHEKQLIISFPNLEVGDAIEVKWSTRGKNPEYFGEFFTRYTFGDDRYPVALDELYVRVPKSRPLKYATVGPKLDPVIHDEGSSRLFHWRVANREGLPQDENLPSKEEFRQVVACSTFTSWHDIGRWKRRLRKGCWDCTPAVRDVVREVTRGLTTPEAKARALTYWVRRHIRYVSVGVTHDYKPHAPADVFASRYGDCKDQAQLLAVMLREAGLRPELVTLGVEDDGQVLPEVPSPWGTHAILLATLAGKQHWIDTTVNLAPWDYLPRHDRGRMTYASDAGGNVRLVRTPALSADLNRVEQTTHVTVAADGASRSRRRAVYYGSAAVNEREDVIEVPVGERRRQVSGALQDSNSRARLRRLTIDDKRLRDYERPLEVSLEFDIPGHFSGTGELEGNLTDGKVWDKLLRFTLDYDRQVPLQAGVPCDLVHRYVVQLPPALVCDSYPKDKSFRSQWGLFRRTVVRDPQDPRRFRVEFHTRLDRTRVEVADLPKFRKFQEDVSQNWRAWFTLRPTRDLADTPLLETLLWLAPQDVASTAALARLYCYRHRFEDARRVLNWARTLHPNEQQFWELTVRAAATTRDEEAAYRKMVRRFPEETKYAVALGAVRVKLGDYAGARAVLEPLARTGPRTHRAAAHYQLARAAFLEDHPERALEHFRAAAREDADSVRGTAAQQFKGQVCEKLGRTGEAGAAYRRALRADRRSRPALLALIRLELAAGHRNDAVDYLRRYTLAVRGDVQGMVRAADYHLQLGRLDDALDLATRALDIRFDVQARRVAGLIWWKRGDAKRAAAALERAERTAEVRRALLESLVTAGDLPRAFKELDGARSVKDPPAGLRRACELVAGLKERCETLHREVNVPAGREDAYSRAIQALVLAEHAHAAGVADKAVAKTLAAVFAGGVELAPAYSLRGRLNLETGRLTKALADAERALALGKLDAGAYYVRGRVRFERGAPGALADLARAAELSRHKDPAVLQALAAALLREHRREDALATQREAVKLKPKDPEIQEQLREIERAGK
jgi:tetratricopeptide (TPR) repeat protein/transglutaminase-like putative cysteine protease